MRGDMRTEQEQLVQAISERAAPYVFKPLHTRKRDDEIADVAAVCNDCVFLLYTTGIGSFPKARRHNLNQAAGGFKRWKRGDTPLAGSNQSLSFALDYDPRLTVVVLSVVDCKDAMVEFHPDKAAKLGVTLCATVPLKVLSWLSHRHGSFFDLLSFFWSVRRHAPLPEAHALKWVLRYTAQCLELSGAAKLWPRGHFDERFTEAAYPFVSLRGADGWKDTMAAIRAAYHVKDLANIFCDVGIRDFFFGVVAARTLIDENLALSREKADNVVLNRKTVRWGRYNCYLCAMTHVCKHKFSRFKPLMSRLEKQVAAGIAKPGPAVLYDCLGKAAMTFHQHEVAGQTNMQLMARRLGRSLT